MGGKRNYIMKIAQLFEETLTKALPLGMSYPHINFVLSPLLPCIDPLTLNRLLGYRGDHPHLGLLQQV